MIIEERVNTCQKQPFADVFQNRCLWEFRNIHRKTPVLESLLNKVAGSQTLLKGTPTLVFSCEYCEIAKNSFFSQNTSGGCFPPAGTFAVKSACFNVNFEVAYEVECEVNYRYVRIIVELVSVYINILQVIWLLNNLC